MRHMRCVVILRLPSMNFARGSAVTPTTPKTPLPGVILPGRTTPRTRLIPWRQRKQRVRPSGCNPVIFWSYSVLGEALELQARYEEAIAAYEYALQLNPDLQPWGGLGRLYYNQGKYEEALSTYDKIVNAGSKDMYDWLFYFVYSSRAGKFDEAQARLREFSKSLKDESWIAPVVLFYSGEISENMVWKSAEHEDLQKAREQKCEAYYYLGIAYLLNKELRLKSAAPDTAKAQEYFEQCLTTNITDIIEYEEAKKELERLENIKEFSLKD